MTVGGTTTTARSGAGGGVAAGNGVAQVWRKSSSRSVKDVKLSSIPDSQSGKG